MRARGRRSPTSRSTRRCLSRSGSTKRSRRPPVSAASRPVTRLRGSSRSGLARSPGAGCGRCRAKRSRAVALVEALTSVAKVLLVEEPLASVDARAAGAIAEALRARARGGLVPGMSAASPEAGVRGLRDRLDCATRAASPTTSSRSTAARSSVARRRATRSSSPARAERACASSRPTRSAWPRRWRATRRCATSRSTAGSSSPGGGRRHRRVARSRGGRSARDRSRDAPPRFAPRGRDPLRHLGRRRRRLPRRLRARARPRRSARPTEGRARVIDVVRLPLARLTRTPRALIPVVAWAALAIARGACSARPTRRELERAGVDLRSAGPPVPLLRGRRCRARERRPRPLDALARRVRRPSRARRAGDDRRRRSARARSWRRPVGALVAALAHGAGDPPVARDALASAWVAGLGGAAYASLFCFGASFGKRGGGARGRPRRRLGARQRHVVRRARDAARPSPEPPRRRLGSGTFWPRERARARRPDRPLCDARDGSRCARA